MDVRVIATTLWQNGFVISLVQKRYMYLGFKGTQDTLSMLLLSQTAFFCFPWPLMAWELGTNTRTAWRCESMGTRLDQA